MSNVPWIIIVVSPWWRCFDHLQDTSNYCSTLPSTIRRFEKVNLTLNFLHKTSSPAEMRPTIFPCRTTRTANPPFAWLFSNGISVTGPSSTSYLGRPETWKTFGGCFEGVLDCDRGGEIGLARVKGGDGGGVGVLDRDWVRSMTLSSSKITCFDVSVLILGLFEAVVVFLLVNISAWRVIIQVFKS